MAPTEEEQQLIETLKKVTRSGADSATKVKEIERVEQEMEERKRQRVLSTKSI